MFQFLKYREKQKEVAKTTRLFTKLRKEYENNYTVLVELGGEIANGSTELAKLLRENKKVRDLFVLAVYRLDFLMYNTYYHDTDWQLISEADHSVESYLELFEQSHQIEYLCQAIVENKVNTEESVKQLLLLITEKISALQEHQLVLDLREEQTETESQFDYTTDPAGVEMVQE